MYSILLYYCTNIAIVCNHYILYYIYIFEHRIYDIHFGSIYTIDIECIYQYKIVWPRQNIIHPYYGIIAIKVCEF